MSEMKYFNEYLGYFKDENRERSNVIRSIFF